MAKREIKKKRKREAPQKQEMPSKRHPRWHSEKHLSLGTANYVLFALGTLSIIVGFVLLEFRFMIIAPLLLVIGFSFLIPISIIVGVGKGGDIKERIEQSGGKME